jgi:hypothetical protein
VWETRHSLRANADPAAVWALWSDPGRWPEWNEQIARVEFDGAFEVGTTAKVKFNGGGTVHYRITELEPERLLVDEARLPGARIGHEHRVTPSNGGVEISNRIYIAGPLTRLYALLMGRRTGKAVPALVERERELAERP